MMKRRSLFKRATERTLRSVMEAALTMQVELAGRAAIFSLTAPARSSSREMLWTSTGPSDFSAM